MPSNYLVSLCLVFLGSLYLPLDTLHSNSISVLEFLSEDPIASLSMSRTLNGSMSRGVGVGGSVALGEALAVGIGVLVGNSVAVGCAACVCAIAVWIIPSDG
jgi:hypothetical protein